MTSREQFEAWFAVDIVGCQVNFPEFDDGGYTEGDLYDDRFYLMLQSMWMAWQASRAEIEVELPERQDAADCYCLVYPVDDVIFSLNEAGLKVKK